MPPVVRESPVANVADLPMGPRFEVNHQIHASTVLAVGHAAAEDDLTAVPTTTDLPRRESERDQDRIEKLPNQDLRSLVGTTTSGHQARTSTS